MAKTSPLQTAAEWVVQGKALTIGSVPDGFDAMLVADLARVLSKKAPERPAVLVFVARDGQRQALIENGLAFVAPEIEVLSFPAWDCQPYDRVSPNAAIAARRMTVLSRLARTRSGEDKPRILTTTVNAILQRLPRLKRVAGESFSAAPGNVVDINDLARLAGRTTASSVPRPCARPASTRSRGGIVDLYAPGLPIPVRLDFFGDTLELIRSFDPETPALRGPASRARPRADERGAADDRDDQALPPGLSSPSFGARRGTTRSTRR